MRGLGQRVLPQQFLGRQFRTEIARERPHVAVNQFVPGAGEGVGQLLWVGEEASGDGFIDRIETQGQVRGQHRRRTALGGIVGVWNGVSTGTVLRPPLIRPRRALGQFPFETEQVFQKMVAPLGRCLGPGHFQAAGDGVSALTGAKTVLPAEALLLDISGFRFSPDIVRRPCTVGFAEGVTASDQRHGLFVIHGHATEGFTDIQRRLDRVRIALRSFRVDVDQAHLHGGKGVFQIAPMLGAAFLIAVLIRFGDQSSIARFLHHFVFAIAGVATQPLAFRAPIHVFIWRPDVRTAARETEGFKTHALQGDVTGENNQVGPGNFTTVLLLDRPQQTAGLVQADVVRPTVEGRETLLARARATTTVTCAVGTGTVPGHAYEERAIVPKIRWPPVLGIGHQRTQVLLERREVEALERFGVVKAFVHGVGQGRVLVQDLQIQLVRPPVAVRCAAAGGMVERAFRFCRHV